MAIRQEDFCAPLTLFYRLRFTANSKQIKSNSGAASGHIVHLLACISAFIRLLVDSLAAETLCSSYLMYLTAANSAGFVAFYHKDKFDSLTATLSIFRLILFDYTLNLIQ